jgi:hypothetical protein
MFKAIGRIGTDKGNFRIVFEPISISVKSGSPTFLVLIFKRGDAKPEKSKHLSIKRGDFATYTFQGESFVKECSFYVEKGKVEAKTATIMIAEVNQDKDIVIYEDVINLSSHIGAAFQDG